MKKILVPFFIIAALFLFTGFTTDASAPLNAYLFWGDGCPHCAKEHAFLQTIKDKYPSLEINGLEIYHNNANAAFFQEVARALDAEVIGVPFLVIGDKYIVGFAEGITPNEIEDRIKECLTNVCPDFIAKMLGADTEEEQEPIEEKEETVVADTEGREEDQIDKKERIVNFPFFGEINVSKLSLPILTIALGVLDGFNPCAMWALLFLISLLLGMKDRKRMWILGTTFIVASAFVYFIFMAAWLNLILFLGFVIWVRIAIGILALFGGSYSLKEFLSDKGAVCEISNNEGRQKIFQKLKSVIGQNSFWLALGGIVTLAFLVNLVELICSAGLPAIYTQILSLSELARWQYYLYLLLYIFFFMLDDLFVFFVAMVTLQMTGITTKYTKYSRLIGGILMLAIGLTLIFKPQWLMFG